MAQIFAAMTAAGSGYLGTVHPAQEHPWMPLSDAFVFYDSIIIPWSDEQSVSGVGNIGEQKVALKTLFCYAVFKQEGS